MWTDGIKNSIETAEALGEALDLSEEQVEKMAGIIDRFPMRIPQYYLDLVDRDDPDDPIARMCIPSEYELSRGGSFDTSGEKSNTKEEGVQHKYTQTALILSTNVCAMYCRHCFRKRLVGLTNEELMKQMDAAVSYVKSHPEITNVLITGGDSFMLPNNIIKSYLEAFTSLPNIDLIRFGTRIPVSYPLRITEDPELIEILREYSKKKPIYVITQFNHPREFTETSIKAVKMIQELGIQMRNQTVLLRGVNDDPEVLGTLLRELTRQEIVPYYIFQCRPVTGVKDRFQVPLLEGVKIVDAAKGMQSGIGKCVRYCMSHPLGKIEILGDLGDGNMLFKFHQNKYPEDRSRIFTVKLDEKSTWLTDELDPE